MWINIFFFLFVGSTFFSFQISRATVEVPVLAGEQPSTCKQNYNGPVKVQTKNTFWTLWQDLKTHVHKCFPSNLKTWMDKEFSLHVKNWIIKKIYIKFFFYPFSHPPNFTCALLYFIYKNCSKILCRNATKCGTTWAVQIL